MKRGVEKQVTTTLRATPARLIAGGLCLLVVAVFGQVLTFGFVSWDDPTHVTENPLLNPVTPTSLARFWTELYSGQYSPLSYMFFAAEAAIGRESGTSPNDGLFSPAVFHAGSLFLHGVCVVLVFVILQSLTHARLAAALGAAVFAVHPLQVESVAWVSETRGLLSTAFALLALWQYIAAASPSAEPSGMPGRLLSRSATHYVAATLALIAALLSKPSAAPLPIIAAIVDAGILKRPWRQVARSIFPWLLITAVFSWGMTYVQPPEALPFIPPWWSRPLVASDAIAFYFGKLLWPSGLAILHDHAPARVLASSWPYYACVLLVALAGAAWFVRRRLPITVLASAVFVAGLLPVLGFVPFHFQRFSTVADRYAYLAMLGPALAVSAIVAQGPRSVATRAITVIVVVWACWSFQLTQTWRDDVALYTRALDVNPNSHAAHHNLAKAFVRLDRRREAEESYRAALAADPSDVESHLGLGTLLVRQGRTDEAATMFARAVEIAPTNARAYNNLATITSRKSPEEALPIHQTAIKLDPHDAEAHNNMGNTLARLGRYSEAIERYHEALRLSPGYSNAVKNLALAEQLRRRQQDTPR